MLCRANAEYSSLQKKLASDLALEKAAAKKVELEVASLDKNLQKLVIFHSLSIHKKYVCITLAKKLREKLWLSRVVSIPWTWGFKSMRLL